jgi:hypothetical protein
MPSGAPSSSSVQRGGRRAAGRLGISAAYRTVGCENQTSATMLMHQGGAPRAPLLTCHVPIPAGSPFHAACTGSIPGLLSVDMHAPVSSLYYTHAPQLHPTRYIFHTQYSPPDLAEVHGTTRLLPISWCPGRVLKGISFKGFRNKSLLSNPFLQQFRNLAFSLITTRHLPVTSGKDRLAIPHSVSYEEF